MMIMVETMMATATIIEPSIATRGRLLPAGRSFFQGSATIGCIQITLSP